MPAGVSTHNIRWGWPAICLQLLPCSPRCSLDGRHRHQGSYTEGFLPTRGVAQSGLQCSAWRSDQTMRALLSLWINPLGDSQSELTTGGRGAVEGSLRHSGLRPMAVLCLEYFSRGYLLGWTQSLLQDSTVRIPFLVPSRCPFFLVPFPPPLLSLIANCHETYTSPFYFFLPILDLMKVKISK